MLESVHERFTNGDGALRKSIMSELGWNLLIKDKTLICQAKKPFLLVQKRYRQALGKLGGLEPAKGGFTEPQNSCFAEACRIMWARGELKLTVSVPVFGYFISQAHKISQTGFDSPRKPSRGFLLAPQKYFVFLWARGESNSQSFRNMVLNHARLPVSPLAQFKKA